MELKLEKSTVTRFLTSLETGGYLRRERSGRERLLHPTRRAVRISGELQKCGDRLYRQMTAELGESAMAALVGDIRAAADKLER